MRELRSLVWSTLDELRGSAPDSSTAWRETEHAMVMWALATTFVTFCEDNGFVADRSLSRADLSEPESPEDALQTIEWAIERVVRAHPVLGAAFQDDSGAWRNHSCGPRAAHRLVSYWHSPDRPSLRAPAPPVGSGPDHGFDTTVLGSLYQDLSEDSRKADALLTTPGFVVDLLLEQTLKPSLRDASVTGHGFRFIDPACGSGGFLLKALPMVLERIRTEQPELPLSNAVALALACVHGSDRNPFAVMVSRFRLAIEALCLSEGADAADERDWRILVVRADSLLEGTGAPEEDGPFTGLTGPSASWPSSARDADVLARSSYDVVATNPPYITPKGKKQADSYRRLYPSARSGPFAMTVPFTECAFSLTRAGGSVGLLTANSFAKREFGKALVEEFLPTVKLERIVDTSGAYIPGHGTPTLILIGSNQRPEAESQVTVVSGLRGEPSLPDDPRHGQVWASIRERLSTVPSEDLWTASEKRPLAEYCKHPWILAAPKPEKVFQSLRSHRTLGDTASRIGYVASTGADDLFTSSPASMRRWGCEPAATIDAVTGSEVRDWQSRSERVAFFPRNRRNQSHISDIRALPGHLRRLWPYKHHLKNRLRTEGKPWYDWHQLTVGDGVSSWSIIFPWVATHPHFALRQEANAPLNSAPVIELPPSVTEEQVLGLLGILNSSTACFWFKQVSNTKGSPRNGQLRSGDTWDTVYEFTATRMRDLPLPRTTEAAIPRELDTLARRLLELRVEVGDPEHTPTQERIIELGQEWHATLNRMMVLQEELDWRTYEAYGLIPEGSLSQVSCEELPDGIDVGQRAFEIVLATRVASGAEESAWFDRHGAAPTLEIPEQWGSGYRNTVSKRVAAIEDDPVLQVLERADFKHRWTTPPWEQVWRPAVTSWLLDRCERRELWYAQESEGSERPTARTVSELVSLLAGDPDVIAAVEALSPGDTPHAVLPDLLQQEHVPFLAALRLRRSGLEKYAAWSKTWDLQWNGERQSPLPPKYRSSDFLRTSYWNKRGKFDLPDERFISYPAGTSPALSPTSVLGWAGWDARERAWVLVDLIEQHLAPPTAATGTVVPLLAGLAEVLPWVGRVGAGIGPTHPHGDQAQLLRRYEGFRALLDLTEKEVAGWRPPPPRRGRPPKRKGA
ncbi:BREX-2 system adenine-specific DNA-methyltransferase PglX [Nocardiopsis sp. CNT312]|uniref:BREX-2 system adenine-specific DNA-methyltransferase PglX n=1 Tax=Nocardiopsis sp. CNT312 TaxID=1137268 RepID=UPI0012DC368E|nr:BREX-2 system adenine-specific DNA-methyltransferase PglX [Nocardiopsis sp. CNT312]